MCNQCQNVRATIFSEQTQELMCTDAEAAGACFRASVFSSEVRHLVDALNFYVAP